MRYFILLFNLIVFSSSVFSQNGIVKGRVVSDGKPLSFTSIYIEKTNIGTVSDTNGDFVIDNLSEGSIILTARAIGYVTSSKRIVVEPGKEVEVEFILKEDILGLEEIVISGTRTDKRRVESAIPVNVLDSEMFTWSQSNTLVDGLNFLPGVRTEIDCQTCNYSQIRINGLGGAYSQILINSRPIFSSLQGLYGLEQIPASMVDRVEVIRGGGSALYGSNAIAGVVNVITKMPERSSYEVSVNHALIDRQAHDNFINTNITTLNESRNAGAIIFASRRDRQEYDANGDGFSEMPKIRNTTFGFNSFYKFDDRSNLGVNFSTINEQRRGGNMISGPPHQADQSEDRVHNILSGGVNFDYVLTEKKSSLSFYIAGQQTTRDHFTGIMPDIEYDHGSETNDSSAYINYLLEPPYGTTLNRSLQGGLQFNHAINRFLFGRNTFTVGFEYLNDNIKDEIKAYEYLIDQKAHELGLFIQSDWDMFERLTLLTGVRITNHNYVDQTMISPRVSILYKVSSGMQIRTSVSSGFRAPQAFDADLHMAFAGGGISRILIHPDLKEELSRSFSSSIDYNRSSLNYIYGFTLEGFYTRLDRTFIYEGISEPIDDAVLLLKKNGGMATVGGVSLELRGNYKALFQLETGISLQRSTHDRPIEWSSSIEGTSKFLRTPDVYGFYVFSYMPVKSLNVSLSGVLTGPMLVPHYGGAPGVDGDLVYRSPTFFDNNIKLEYPVMLKNINQMVRIFAGAKNIFNQYQSDFDLGKMRDSNYVYGPASPRSLFFGIKLGGE